MSERYTLYFKNEKAIKQLKNMKNRSEYVERAVIFFMDNKDAIKGYADHITALTRQLIDEKR